MLRALFMQHNFIYDSAYDWGGDPTSPAQVVRHGISLPEIETVEKLSVEMKEAKPDENQRVAVPVKPAAVVCERAPVAYSPRRASKEIPRSSQLGTEPTTGKWVKFPHGALVPSPVQFQDLEISRH
jgi:hypothetical protein